MALVHRGPPPLLALVAENGPRRGSALRGQKALFWGCLNQRRIGVCFRCGFVCPRRCRIVLRDVEMPLPLLAIATPVGWQRMAGLSSYG